MTESEARALAPGATVHILGYLASDGVTRMSGASTLEVAVVGCVNGAVEVALPDSSGETVLVPFDLILNHRLAQTRNHRILELVRLQQHVAVREQSNPPPPDQS